MTGSKNLHIYLEKKDKYGVAVGTWAVPGAKPGYAKCTWCSSPISFKKGLDPLKAHSESGKHLENAPKNQTTMQLTLEETLADSADSINSELAKRKKSKQFQLELVRSLSRHRIPFEYIDCLIPILKKYVNDDIIQNLKLHHSKGAYLVKNAVSKSYQDETVKLLEECDALVVGFDETEINKTSELEVLVKIAHKNHSIQLRHYQTIALESGHAETIVNSLLDAFKNDGIDIPNKLIGCMSDGCNVMEGRLNGVKKKFLKLIPQFQDFGSCNSHHIGNALKYAVQNFDNDCHEALVNLFFDLGGAKGRGLKRLKEFQKVAALYGINPAQFKKVCTTRFRSYHIAIKPVLSNWHAIVAYYKSVKKPTDRQSKLIEFFVNQEFMSKLKLSFIWASAKELIEGLDFFEQRKEEIHKMHTKMMEMLAFSLLRHQQRDVVEVMDDDGNVQMKEPRHLLDADVMQESTQLSRKQIFVGKDCNDIMKALGLNPSSLQMGWFYEKVLTYYATISKYLQKYFRKGLLSTSLKYMQALSPKKRKNFATPHMLRYLAKSLSKVAENIQPTEGTNTLLKEIEMYSLDESLDTINMEMSYQDYWVAVGNVKVEEWPKYDVLPRFALCMGAFFNSNSEVERAFSAETDIHRDPKKNRMSQDMLDAHMNIRFGVESDLSYDKSQCTKCKSSRVRPHCHCSQSVISERMLQKFDGAYNTEDEEERDEASVSEEGKAELVKQETVRLNKLKEELAKRKTFYDVMNVVYEKDAEKSTAESSVDDALKETGSKKSKKVSSKSGEKTAESSVNDTLKETSSKKSKKGSSKSGEKRKNPKDDCPISEKSSSSSKQVLSASTTSKPAASTKSKPPKDSSSNSTSFSKSKSTSLINSASDSSSKPSGTSSILLQNYRIPKKSNNVVAESSSSDSEHK